MVKNNTFRLIKDYINFRMQSVNLHGLHSPFMYKLTKNCFYDKSVYPEYQMLKQYHKDTLYDKRIIEVVDFGAGSKFFKNNKRKISNISKHSGSSPREMKLLFRLAKYFKPEKILELGTSLGKSSYALSIGNPKATITTIEGSLSLAKTAETYHEKYKIKNIKIINTEFDDFLDILDNNIKYDFIFLDGNHKKEATIGYFEKLLAHIHNNTIIILDDIYWSEEMKETWNILIRHTTVKQSINTFHYGFLFFRKEQFPENFIIRL